MYESFESIRREFFPRWDRDKKWSFAEDHPDCRGYGLCDLEGKQIVVTPGCPHGQDVTMIHEICHAVASVGHAKKWQNRMEMAAQMAETIGRTELAAEIRSDYTAYSDPDRCMPTSAIFVYTEVEDAVHETHGEVPFEEIVDFVADANGVTSEKLLAKFKRLRKVYDNARREDEEYREAEEIKKWLSGEIRANPEMSRRIARVAGIMRERLGMTHEEMYLIHRLGALNDHQVLLH